MNQPTLRDKTISGIFWSLLQNVGGKGITFIVMIILARLLTPEIFGLIGMLMIFIQVSQALVVAGFNQALIQKKDTDEEDYSSVFWINLVISVLIYAILFFTAPYIAAFYEQPILTELSRTLSLVFVINAFSYVQEARLSKEMRFKTLTLVSIPSTVIGGIVSIVMAVMGFGVWSIIALQLVTRFAYAVQIWVFSKWQPLWIYNATKVKIMFSYGGKLMIKTLIETVYQNIYLVVIGKFFPISAVGYYQNAYNLVQYPATTFSGALSKVSFSALSTIQEDQERLKRAFKMLIQQSMLLLCPAFIFAAVLAEPLFRFVFTEKWLPAVPYFQILCVVGIMYPLNMFNMNIINVKGRSDITLKLEVVKRIFITVGIIIAIPYGIFALLYFQATQSVLMFILNASIGGRIMNYNFGKQLKAISPILLLSLGIGAIIFILDHALVNLSDVLRLSIGFFTGCTLYILVAKYGKITPYVELSIIFYTKIKPFLIKNIH